MAVHLALGLNPMVLLYIGSLIGLVAFSYTSCVHQGHCPKFLPTISDTWVYPPENYVSRWIVGNLCIGMGLVQYPIFRFDQGGLSHGLNKTLLYVGFISCVLLSFVGAVCDSTVPSCRGNNTVHSTSAVAFFIGYNVMMAVVTLKKPDPVTSELACVAGSTLAKLRFSTTVMGQVSSMLDMGSFPWLAVVEWTDVALILAWTGLYVTRRGKDYRFGIINRNSDDGDTPAALDFWSLDFCKWIMTIWYIGTLAISAVIYYAQGRWPHGGIPYISDTWVYPPGNWISRWAVVGCATVASFAHACIYYLDQDAPGRVGQTGWMTVLAIVACFGVSLVGVCDESENIVIHGTGATLFFAGYDLFMVLIAAQLLKGEHSWRGLATGLCAILSIASKLRFHSASSAALVGLWPYIPQALEWTDAITIAVFFLTYFGAFGDRTKNIGLALFRVAEKTACVFPEA